MVCSVSQERLAAKLKRLNPSVQCGDNQMTLTVNRIKAPHFLVDSGEFYILKCWSIGGKNHVFSLFWCQTGKPPTPLAQMPASCGFSVKRSRRHVQYAASYQGCHVSEEVRAPLQNLLIIFKSVVAYSLFSPSVGWWSSPTAAFSRGKDDHGLPQCVDITCCCLLSVKDGS